MSFASFSLPLPPSLNNIFFNAPKRGRVKTTEYKNWLELCGWEIRKQRVPAVTGEVRVSLIIERPNANSDIDNRIKPVLDALQKAGVLKNDNKVVEIAAKWGEVIGCHVMIFTAEQAAA